MAPIEYHDHLCITCRLYYGTFSCIAEWPIRLDHYNRIPSEWRSEVLDIHRKRMISSSVLLGRAPNRAWPIITDQLKNGLLHHTIHGDLFQYIPNRPNEAWTQMRSGIVTGIPPERCRCLDNVSQGSLDPPEGPQGPSTNPTIPPEQPDNSGRNSCPHSGLEHINAFINENLNSQMLSQAARIIRRRE